MGFGDANVACAAPRMIFGGAEPIFGDANVACGLPNLTCGGENLAYSPEKMASPAAGITKTGANCTSVIPNMLRDLTPSVVLAVVLIAGRGGNENTWRCRVGIRE